MSVPKGEIVVQAFIQALLSTAIFSQRLSFLLFTRSLNMDIKITGKCISQTLFDFKAYIHCPSLINTIFPVNIMVW